MTYIALRGKPITTQAQVRADTLTSTASSGPTVIAFCCLAIILALVVGVGIPDKLVLRHIVQTLPLWPVIVLGFRRSNTVGWASLPLFLFWLLLMTLIWLYLLGVSHLINGHFSPLEIAMTLVVGAASLVGIGAFWRFKSGLSAVRAVILFVVFAAFQFSCLRVSLLPSIAHR
ncbi:MAG TPA: hypothetical protein VJN69_07535 [Candidatus Acidoferrales bacterium]|nr:hypothetical protein [Candidatus Acidoferrales bacterium]